nr:hypothetical protein [Mycobacterium sp. E3298]
MGYALIILIGFIVGALSYYFFDEEFEIEISVLSGLIGALIALLPMLVAAMLIHSFNDQEEYIKEEIPMVALKDNVGVSGRFFLGSGSVDDEMKYYYMVQSDKGMQIQSVSAEKSYLIETDKEQPVIKITDKRFKNKNLERWFPSWESGDTTIYVPKGSIDYNYKVDLQ